MIIVVLMIIITLIISLLNQSHGCGIYEHCCRNLGLASSKFLQQCSTHHLWVSFSFPVTASIIPFRL